MRQRNFQNEEKANNEKTTTGKVPFPFENCSAFKLSQSFQAWKTYYSVEDRVVKKPGEAVKKPEEAVKEKLMSAAKFEKG